MAEATANPASRWIAAAVALLAAAWFLYSGGKHELAAHYAASPDPNGWLHASRIEPENAEIWYKLARYRQLDFDNPDLPLSISYYKRAVQLNPRSPYYKLDLAGALEMNGDNAEADTYFRAALAAYPKSGEISWKYGNFLLRQNRLGEAYAQLHHAVIADPTLLPLAVSRVWHGDPDIHHLLDDVLPDTPGAYQSALTFLAGAQEPAAALEAWRRLIAKDPHTERKWAFPLTDMLVAQEKYDDAGQVWRQAVAADPGSTPGYTGNSLVYDGGFEQDIADGGFAWRQKDLRGAELDSDADEKHSGARSARLTFDGTENMYFAGLFQNVLVSPGTRYRFQGFLHTDRISTESGVRFEIFDPKDPRELDEFTRNETGSVPWTSEQLDFTAGSRTHLIQIRVARKPSERLDNKLRGTAWIDDVSLIPLAKGGDAGTAESH